MVVETFVSSTFLTLWGLWCLFRAPKLAVHFARRPWSAFEAEERPMGPAGWRMQGLLWCALGIWGITVSLAR